MHLRIPHWISHRAYKTQSELKIAITNEHSQEFIILEEAAALLWDRIARDRSTSLKHLCTKLAFPIHETQQFVDELCKIGLLASSDHCKTSNLPEEASSHLSTEDALVVESEFQRWARTNGFLWSASWETTYRCNEECLHCYNPGASRDHSVKARRGTQELKASEWLPMLQQLAEIGVFRLSLTGGETLLRTDLFDILREAKALGFSINLLTNGLLIDEEMATQLAELWLHRIELSLYSLAPETHDAITGVEGSQQLTVRAARLLKERGAQVMLKMVLTKNTLGEVQAFQEFATSIGCDSVVDGTLSIGNDGSLDTLSKLAPSASELILAAMDRTNPLWCGDVGSPRNGGTLRDPDDFPCAAGHAAISISPEGNIYPCLAFPLHLGSQRESGVKQVWEKSRLGSRESCRTQSDALSRWQAITLNDFSHCGVHERCAWCQKCPGASFLETGIETSPSSSKCRNAAARMIAYAHLSRGRPNDTISKDAMDGYRNEFPKEHALWSEPDKPSVYINLDDVRKTLRERSKQRILRITRSTSDIR